MNAAAQISVETFGTHPARESLASVFAEQSDCKPSGITRDDYLTLIAGNVDFFKNHQNDAGVIIDPREKREIQYATPTFAFAASTLVKHGGRDDLKPAAIKALDAAIRALVAGKAAESHPDFYIPLIINAHRNLAPLAGDEQSAQWKKLLGEIIPQKIYRQDLRGMNWNIVSCSGELLRRKDGLVLESQLKPQWDYLETCIGGHLDRFTPIGLYDDPGAPLAYDAFSRLWLEMILAYDAYDGKHAEVIRKHLRNGGLSTLLLISPTGEWASGGRSALHQWNEAEIAAICEMNALVWKNEPRIAGAFKRAAHLSLQSMKRWQRPSGEMWIVKNRADPQERFGYERYSHHSQYNLLPMAMLAMAYQVADESIAEAPIPAEVGGYVFDARETFHKVAAAAGGYYVLIDTAADPHYNATGLQRVHRIGVQNPALNDTPCADRAYAPTDAPKLAISPGIQWKTADGAWMSLADFSERHDKEQRNTVEKVELEMKSTDPKLVEFILVYSVLTKEGKRYEVTENYQLNGNGIAQLNSIKGDGIAQTRTQFPILVNDGAQDTEVSSDRTATTVRNQNSLTTIYLDGAAQLDEARIPTHSGWVRQLVSLPSEGAQALSLRVQLSE